MGGFCFCNFSLGSCGLALGLDGYFFALHVGVGAFPFDGLISLLSHISLYFAFVFRFVW